MNSEPDGHPNVQLDSPNGMGATCPCMSDSNRVLSHVNFFPIRPRCDLLDTS